MEIPLEARKKYVERRIAEIATSKKALAEKDYVFLERMGHQIKGNAATFGFDELTPIATNLELSAKSKNESEISKILNLFENTILNIKL